MEENMGNEEVTVLGFWESPFVDRVIWALEFKGIRYRFIEEDMTKKQRSQLLLDSNPVHKKIPVLFHRGRSIVESLLIVEYIEEAWPEKPLMPTDPYERAMTRFWIKFGEDMLFLLYTYSITTGNVQKNAAEELQKQFSVLEEKCLGDKMFFGGDTIGLIDLAFGWIAYWLPAVQETSGGESGDKELMDRNSLPRLAAWCHAFKEFPLINNKLPDHAKLVEFLLGYRKNKIN